MQIQTCRGDVTHAEPVRSPRQYDGPRFGTIASDIDIITGAGMFNDPIRINAKNSERYIGHHFSTSVSGWCRLLLPYITAVGLYLLGHRLLVFLSCLVIFHRHLRNL